jgi:glycosyltransferase involved in cell wall biosynthesis
MEVDTEISSVGNRRPLVSVIIAAYHSAAFLPRCLASIESQTFRDFETILVNSSPDTETAAVAAAFPSVHFFQNPERLFPHAARNVGVSMARGSLLVFTDADCEADPGWLAALVAAHDAGRDIIGGCIDSKATRNVSCGIHLLKYSPYLRGKPAGPIPLAATGNLMTSRTVWEVAGPFDGSIFCGDALFSWKARKAGFAPWYEPTAIVIDQDEHYRKGFFSERFRRGREFGRVRADCERWGIIRRGIGIACVPLATVSALAKTGRECLRSGRFADFVATLPFQVTAHAAWCAGEALGYAATTNVARGGSTRIR